MIQFNGQNTFKEIHYNSYDIKKVYGWCSGDLVWEKETQPFAGKFKLTLADTSVITGDCTSNTTVKINDVEPYRSTVISAEIGQCATDIANSAFHNCTELTSVIIPDNVTSIGRGAFYASENLKSCAIGSGITTLTNTAFGQCISLSSVTIPDSVITIEEAVFFGCTGLITCTIGSGVTSIGDETFRDCNSLTSVTIPSDVASIGEDAFFGSSGLTSFTCLATTPPALTNRIFSNIDNCPIYVPAASVNAYKTATIWSKYADRIQPIPGT